MPSDITCDIHIHEYAFVDGGDAKCICGLRAPDAHSEWPEPKQSATPQEDAVKLAERILGDKLSEANSIPPAYFQAAHDGLAEEKRKRVERIEIQVRGSEDPSRVARLLRSELNKLSGRWSENRLPTSWPESYESEVARIEDLFGQPADGRFIQTKARMHAQDAKAAAAIIGADAPTDFTPEWFAKYNGEHK